MRAMLYGMAACLCVAAALSSSDYRTVRAQSAPVTTTPAQSTSSAPVAAQSAPAVAPSPARQARPATTTSRTRTSPAVTISDADDRKPAPTLPAETPRAPSAPQSVNAAKPAVAAEAAQAPLAPQQVITVVHRLSGWKLLSMLAAARSPRVVGVDDFSLAPGVHTNVVAGYVMDDGRTIIACLPQAEIESETRAGAATNAPKLFGDFPSGTPEESELTVVRGDGKEFKASFIGLDGSTGLSFLEVAEPVLPPAPTPIAAMLREGQRVRLFAPEPIAPVAARPTVNQLMPSPTPPAPNRTVGDEGVIYSGMGALEGELTELKRAPTGKVLEATVRSRRLSPEWTGAIAINDAGALVGILAENYESGETRLVPAEGVRGATARVMARRASVPQPWLGARGDDVAKISLEKFLASGWPREKALALLNKRLGVMLTAVVPGTPAAEAGLLPGDVVARVSERVVGGVEDFSFFLREAGGGSTLDFTVFRAQLPAALKMSVKLSGALNPAIATHEAEVRAAEVRARMAGTEARLVELKARTAQTEEHAALLKAQADELDARRRGDPNRLAEAQRRLAEASERYEAESKRLADAVRRVEELDESAARAQQRLAEAQRMHFGLPGGGAQLAEGLDTIAIFPKFAARFQAQGGLLVVAVRPNSQAARAGLRPGDVIETVDGQLIPEPDKSSKLLPNSNPTPALGVVRGGQRLTIQLPPRAKE